MLIGEDGGELDAFREGMMAELAPEGELEWLLADRVVESAWRLRRAARMERAVVEDSLATRRRAANRAGRLHR